MEVTTPLFKFQNYKRKKNVMKQGENRRNRKKKKRNSYVTNI